MGSLDFKPTFYQSRTGPSVSLYIYYLSQEPHPLTLFLIFFSIMPQQEIQFPIIFVYLFSQYLFLCGVGWMSEQYRFGNYSFPIAVYLRRDLSSAFKSRSRRGGGCLSDTIKAEDQASGQKWPCRRQLLVSSQNIPAQKAFQSKAPAMDSLSWDAEEIDTPLS